MLLITAIIVQRVIQDNYNSETINPPVPESQVNVIYISYPHARRDITHKSYLDMSSEVNKLLELKIHLIIPSI